MSSLRGYVGEHGNRRFDGVNLWLLNEFHSMNMKLKKDGKIPIFGKKLYLCRFISSNEKVGYGT